MTFIESFKESTLGQDGKVQSKIVIAYWLVVIATIDNFYFIGFSFYALYRNSLISENELSAAHYPMEALLALLSLVGLLLGVNMVANALMTKYTNPQPPNITTNVNTDKNIVN
jgi:hypothetical protein